MGNQPSQQKNKDRSKLPGIIDSIATKYILTQNFEDLQKLQNPKYCNKLVILTSKIIAERLNNIEIEYLDQRIKQGIEINQKDKDTIIFLKEDTMGKLDVQNSVKKKRMCIGIAKFYIKIAHLFAAIVMIMNPQYTFTSSDGTKKTVDYMRKMGMSKDEKASAKMSKNGLCFRRIQSIIQSQIKDVDDSNKLVEVELRNKICNMNQKKRVDGSGNTISDTMSLSDEPGIPELYKLYMDEFDYNNVQFNSMSEKSKQKYMRDLKLFYKAFTGSSEMPDTIQTFSDIKLRDFHNKPSCNPGSPLQQPYRVKISSKSYKNYGQQLALMMSNLREKQDSFIKILEGLFVYKIDPITKNKEISIHPKLSFDKLQELVEQARDIIVSLYTGCEEDYGNVLAAFESVIEEQIKQNTQEKIRSLEQQSEKVISEI